MESCRDVLLGRPTTVGGSLEMIVNGSIGADVEYADPTVRVGSSGKARWAARNDVPAIPSIRVGSRLSPRIENTVIAPREDF